ncbi:unnamed protein product, partial [marine sediment metagenome]
MNFQMFQAMMISLGLSDFHLFNALYPLQQMHIFNLLVKYGGGILDMRGSIGGQTHARNRFGSYIRARTSPVNPKSSRQVGARIMMMYLAEQWRESPMDNAKREAWATYAAGVDWRNKVDQVVHLTGFNMFIRSNAALIRAGGTLVTDGPPDIGLPPGDPDFYCRFGESG